MKRNLLFLAIMLGWGVMVNSQSLFTEYYTLDSTFADNNVYGVSDLDADVWNNSIYLALNVRHKDFPTFDENFYHIVFSAFRKGQLEYDTIESYSRWYDRQTKVLLKMDANGDPWVFYKRATDDFNHVLFAWHRVEGTWQSFTLDYDVVVNPILVETADNSLMVIYGADHDGITLTAATWNGNSWTFEPILNDQDRIWGFSHLSAVKNQDGTYFAVSSIANDTAFAQIYYRGQNPNWFLFKNETHPGLWWPMYQDYYPRKLGVAPDGTIHYWGKVREENIYKIYQNGHWLNPGYILPPDIYNIQMVGGINDMLEFSNDGTAFSVNNSVFGHTTQLIWRQPNGKVDLFDGFPFYYSSQYPHKILTKENKLYLFYYDGNAGFPWGATTYKVAIEDVDNILRLSSATQQVTQLEPLMVHPNPASDYINIPMTYFDNEKCEVRIVDQSGKLMLLQKDVQVRDYLRVDIRDFTHGVYFISLFDTKKLQTGMILKD